MTAVTAEIPYPQQLAIDVVAGGYPVPEDRELEVIIQLGAIGCDGRVLFAAELGHKLLGSEDSPEILDTITFWLGNAATAHSRQGYPQDEIRNAFGLAATP